MGFPYQRLVLHLNGVFLGIWGVALLFGPSWLLEAAALLMPLPPRPLFAVAGLMALVAGVIVRCASEGAAGRRVLVAVAGAQALAAVVLCAWLLAGGGGLNPLPRPSDLRASERRRDH